MRAWWLSSAVASKRSVRARTPSSLPAAAIRCWSRPASSTSVSADNPSAARIARPISLVPPSSSTLAGLSAALRLSGMLPPR